MNRLSTAYLHAFPSAHPSLSYLTDSLPAFMQEEHQWQRPLLQQAAELDHIYIRVFDAGQSQEWQFSDEQEAAETLALQPAWFLFAEDWNLVEYRRQLQQGQETSLAEQSGYWALFRHQNRIYEEPLNEAQFFLLACLKEGRDLNSACLELEDILEEAALREVEEQIEHWFAQWSLWGWFGHNEA